MPRFSSPLRYPGGKAALANFVRLVLKENNLTSEYAEIYAGGAGVALSLLLEGDVEKIHINDVSLPIFSFWHSVLEESDLLCKKIRDTRVSISEWKRQKNVLKNPQDHSVLELGFSTFFLNRTNRSGILNGGVIGGIQQNGDWKLTARYNKRDLVARIQRIAAIKEKIFLYNFDAQIFIEKVLPTISDSALVYLDPPYYIKGKGLYQNSYSDDDHKKISKLVCEKIGQSWLLSYDNCAEVNKLYAGKRKVEYGIIYTAQDKYEGSEVIFFSKELKIPNVTHPMRLRKSVGNRP